MRAIVAMVLGVAGCAAAAAEAPTRIAVLPIELDDTSGEGTRADQQHRLLLLDADLLARLAASGQYQPAPARLPDGAASVRNCNGCDVAAAEGIGAPLVLTGVVHKVSNLILAMTLVLRDVPSGAVRGTWRVEFRGNTDESWLRAQGWLMRNRVLPPPEAAR